MGFDYDGRRFRSISNTDNGEVDASTLFHYRQEGDIVSATYAGGSIRFGMLLATVADDGALDMRYLVKLVPLRVSRNAFAKVRIAGDPIRDLVLKGR